MPSATPAAEADARPSGCTNFKLRQLMRSVNQHYDAELAKAGLKTTQYSLLSHVVRLGPLRPVDLARAMTLEPSTLSRNLRPLIDAGWIVLTAGGDARSRLVAATPSGRDKRAEAQRRWKAAQLALNARLGAGEVASLHTLLDRCAQRMNQENP